jgi:hypothetical protein
MVAKGKRGFSGGHDRLTGLFEPDVLLPAQYFAAFRRAGGLERERLLMLAVLEDAIDCYQKYAFSRDPRGKQMFDEAVICDTLEINADYVRRGLDEWRAQGQRPLRATTLIEGATETRRATA